MTGTSQCMIICLCETLYGHTINWFFSPSKPLLNSFFPLPTSLIFYVPVILQTTNTSFFLFLFQGKMNYWFILGTIGRAPHPSTHTNSLILTFKSKSNDFWMPPRTFKGKHPVYNSDIVTFQIWPVRIRLSLFTKILRIYSLNLHYLLVCLRAYTKTFNGEEFLKKKHFQYC